MRTVVLGDRPIEVEEWLARGRALGQDLYDEVWDGEYHVAPSAHGRHGHLDDQLAQLLGPRTLAAGLRGSGPCNLGTVDDYRVPDKAYFAPTTKPANFHPTAVLVVEIVVPNDESRDKFGFYAAAGVAEVLIVDPWLRSVEWFERSGDGYQRTDVSHVLATTSAALSATLDWGD